MDIPVHDRADPFEAMKAYRMGLPSGYVVKNYGEGLLMIKPANHTQGRCLYFTVNVDAQGVEVLTALLAYKKESQEAPKSKIETARERMRRAKGI